jgi:poly(hydroxyalkanoate) depolymerase family esterase
MFTYSKKMRSRMWEATRLTRTKQLLKATSVIQQTLKEVLESVPRPEGAEPPPDESVIEGAFHVVEPEAPNLPQVEVTIITHPAPNSGEPQATTQLTIPPAIVNPKESADTAQPTESASAVAGLALPFPPPPRPRPARTKVSEPQPTTAPPQTDQPRVDKGQFMSKSYTNQAGTRSYKLYVPGGYHGQALPLVVMLHGCTQSPDDFATATRMNEFAETHTFFVAYPAQTFKANIGKCWNWFKASEQQRGQGEPAIIAGLTRQIIKTYGLDTRQVYVAGISAGGAMAMVMGMTYPDLYAAVGIQSGVPYGVAHNLLSGLAAIKGVGSVSADRLKSAPGGEAKLRVVPTIVFHGDQDSIVYPDSSAQIVAQWLEIRAEKGYTATAPEVTTHSGQVPAGHAYTRSVYHDGGGAPMMELWLVHGAGHAWSGGNPNVAWTDAKGPDATQEMLRFFYTHPHPEA